MLGGTGESKGSKVSRDESFDREPGLRAALAYEVIYGKPVRELGPQGVPAAIRGAAGTSVRLRIRRTAGVEEEVAVDVDDNHLAPGSEAR